MATKTYIRLVDDIDGTDANETISFAIDGAEYEIDLNEAHSNELREAVSKFTAAARKVGRVKTPPRRSAAATTDTKAIRAWANETGIPINSRGRIQADVIERYQTAH
ncbi:Lsr2 family protein [Arthrobacter sp. MI7-26]|uniref:histone-like nucleoid-structuring protein Lsr2 n=1 Tax=Arthrobacter sp. MI7-26 TaxID=2993653 RepID=UPI002248D7F2|nr:Lsr2 family protein [Arthrobacter sp. MI7-26]MCX2746868.1 Lsr2 family protein [Arthrobacter sp. MI7-26]